MIKHWMTMGFALVVAGGLATAAAAQATPAPASPSTPPAAGAAPQAAPPTPSDDNDDMSSGTDFMINVPVVLFANYDVDSHSIHTTDSGGFGASLRFHWSDRSSIEVRYTLSENTHNYNPNWSEQAYTNEFMGNYVYSLRAFGRVHPFALAGGGAIYFALNNNPGDYFEAISGVDGTSSQTKIAADVGLGADVHLRGHFSARLELREIGYKAPDFALGNPDGSRFTNFAFMTEPSFGLVYHF